MEIMLAKLTSLATNAEVMDREVGVDLNSIGATFHKVRDLVVRRVGELHPPPIVGSLIRH